MPIETTLKTEILNALENTSDVDKSPEELREEWAGMLAKTIANHIKQALTNAINAGVPTPQDGGAGLKATMSAAIQTL